MDEPFDTSVHDSLFKSKEAIENAKVGDLWIEGDENDEPRLMMKVDKKYLEDMWKIWCSPITPTT